MLTITIPTVGTSPTPAAAAPGGVYCYALSQPRPAMAAALQQAGRSPTLAGLYLVRGMDPAGDA